MPQQINHNNKEYIVYDFDCGRDKGFADLRNTIKQYASRKEKEKPYIVISNAFEGEIHFKQHDTFLEQLHTILREYGSKKVVLVMCDANLEQNYTTWCKNYKEKEIIGHRVYFPYTLLHRTIDHYNKHRIRKKELVDKYKHYICMNGAAKPHRFRMVEKLFSNGWDSNGYITYLNRYGANTRHMANENFQGQELLLDFNAKTIDEQSNQEILPNQYKQAVFDIVNESIVSDTSVFITEKVWKPILYKNPFIVLGSKGTCKHLKEFFDIKLYDSLINYSFDDVDYLQRFDIIVNDNLRRIIDMPIEKLNEWLNSKEVQDTLSYNQTKLLNMQIPNQVDYIDKQIHG
tara:strand:- start:534 stop:1568 length:1035 start_codon:yes stop_codon:yes gene_type:complete